MMPWTIDSKSASEDSLLALRAFNFGTDDPPTPASDLEQEYCRLTNQPYPIREMTFARSWAWFRVGDKLAIYLTLLAKLTLK